MSWPASVTPGVPSIGIACAVARGLQVRVLLEGDSDDRWDIVNADGTATATDVKFVGDGIDVA